jgi:hypothetical protein
VPVAAAAADDSATPGTAVMKLYLDDPRQLFNSMDPAPFRRRDLDAAAAAYIVDWASEAPPGVPLGMQLQLGDEATSADDAAMLGAAVQEYFRRRAAATRAQLRRLFRTGRISLVIGLAFLGGAVGLGEFLAGLIGKEGYAWLAKESLIIGGWVALWRPLEIFLYDWWPIRAQARLYDRLARMQVSVK